MEKLKDFVEFCKGVALLTKAQAFDLFAKAVAFFSGGKEDD